MGFSYNNLFKILKDRNISKTMLREQTGISTSTLAKLSKNENVGMDVLEKICLALNCQPGDILSYTFEIKNKLLSVLREEMEMNLKGGIYHSTQIKLAYNSNHIEGSRLSEDQTRYIYETNTIGVEESDETINVDDIIETNNHFDAFRYLLKVAENDLSENIIKEFHRILKEGTSDSRKEWFAVGDYKTKPNTVGERKTSAPKNVQRDIRNLLNDYENIKDKTIEDLIEFHYRFECIHPFQDGNGRVGRLILFKECLKYGFTPIIIEDQYKMYYYRGLKEFEEEKGFLIDTCLNGQDMYRTMMEYFEI
ncbi:MAG: Fic family protein [Agathobacter sp.]|nr:Fic family protein [Agathobacter sp.]